MNVSVDSGKAKEILQKALDAALLGSYNISSEMEEKIKKVLQHTHLTYKYILLNGLLAKVTNVSANPLNLQAGSPLPGAFDARSLCHSVIVPFEQGVLGKRLGGSNEPFLNKPARFPYLSVENAVRRGEDKLTLERLIEIFNQVNEQENAEQELIAALHCILALKSRTLQFSEVIKEEVVSKKIISEFVRNMVASSCEGETLILSVSVLFEIYNITNEVDLLVNSHPTNQSGASSKEISDVDVFDKSGLIRYCIEAKDKKFNRNDVDHAITKVAEYGHNELIFLYGPNASSDFDLDNIVNEYEDKGFYLSFVDIFDFTNTINALSSVISVQLFLDILKKHIDLIRAKDTTIQHCNSILKSVILNRDNE